MVERVGGGPEEERGDRASEGGKNVVEESALLGLFEPLCCNPVVCDSTAADPPSPFCVQIHSHSVELCGQRMLSETALKLAEAGTESCRVGLVALPLPPLPPTPSPLVSTGRQWKEKDKAGALKKRATAQQPFLKMTVSMIPFVSDFLSFAVTAPYVNYLPIPIPGD